MIVKKDPLQYAHITTISLKTFIKAEGELAL